MSRRRSNYCYSISLLSTSMCGSLEGPCTTDQPPRYISALIHPPVHTLHDRKDRALPFPRSI
ncbi:hypothetical protein CC86DRAFT_170669 [Ophiobolus disseminans]|uniref:Uncharacterized protein n=1 Tax=Ophiobolus disseminans TaxID=1469910 RepID=A0A6A6ZCZ9_9PLEO|nr:hypothetical protein CC86DRAFT_170669 [Ophiobolus disseminans]